MNSTSVFEDDIEGAWGSSSYSNSQNCTENMTDDEFLKACLEQIMGPKHVMISLGSRLNSQTWTFGQNWDIYLTMHGQ